MLLLRHINPDTLCVRTCASFCCVATAGVIESYSDDLAPGESNVINLVNKRIKTDSIVIATIACDGYR